MRKLTLITVCLMTIGHAIGDSDIPSNDAMHERIEVGKNARGLMCNTIHGRKFFKFTFPPKLELINKFEAERVPYMTRKNYYSPEDRKECVEFINKLRDYRTGKRKPASGQAITMEQWDILVEGALVKCCS